VPCGKERGDQTSFGEFQAWGMISSPRLSRRARSRRADLPAAETFHQRVRVARRGRVELHANHRAAAGLQHDALVARRFPVLGRLGRKRTGPRGICPTYRNPHRPRIEVAVEIRPVLEMRQPHHPFSDHDSSTTSRTIILSLFVLGVI